MNRFEYKVVPAPQKGTKAKGAKSAEDRFAVSVEQLLNRMGQDGWEYQRAELLPSEERSGLTGSTTNWRNVLVFRRVIEVNETPEPTAVTEEMAQARPIPGPDAVIAPAPISEELKEPPLSLKGNEAKTEPQKTDPQEKT